jgi:beta-N-acetylhexosaminidase
MTAHILFPALDERQPATLSRPVIETVIRGEIGFDGLLLSDDLAMKALSGTPGELSAAVLAAGCDVALNCTGVLEDSRSALAGSAPLTDRAWQRLERARAATAAGAAPAIDRQALALLRDAALKDAA